MLCIISLGFFSPALSNESNVVRYYTDNSNLGELVTAENGIVSSQDFIASEVGRNILIQGGNAVDAAVATGFALAVTHPQAGNLGGGGFMLVSLAEEKDVISLDFRETAPSAANKDMYLDGTGEVDTDRAQYSRLSSGIPGTVMGLLQALEKYGTMSRQMVMRPAIELALNGFIISDHLAESLNNHSSELSIDKSSIEYFLNRSEGEVFKQLDLAKTLKRIAQFGSQDFYSGETADLIVSEMKSGQGLITHADLRNYRVITRKPVIGNYKGYNLYAMSPPSSGGVHIIQMLNILGGYDLKSNGHNSAPYLHKMIEAMRRAYADRSEYLGDPDFVDIPVKSLTSKNYADALRTNIDLEVATPSQNIRPGAKMPKESMNTTHYSIIDRKGNAVSVTYTLNFSYGSGYSVDGAGFLLNNEMDDFSSKPGSPNGYGLIGGEANKIAPAKRPLSSMTPLIIKKDKQVVLVTGSPGGSRIITSVLQMVLNVIEWNMNLSEAVNQPRIHHQWLPDVVDIERGISVDVIKKLNKMGHKFLLDENGNYDYDTLGRVNSVGQDSNLLVGSADPRGPKSAAIGF